MKTVRLLCSRTNAWIIEGYWLWIILLPSKSSSSDFKHWAKTFNRIWHPPNFLSISRSFFFFAFFFPLCPPLDQLSSLESQSQAQILWESRGEAPVLPGAHAQTHTDTQTHKHTHTDTHSSCKSDNKDGMAADPVDKEGPTQRSREQVRGDLKASCENLPMKSSSKSNHDLI